MAQLLRIKLFITKMGTQAITILAILNLFLQKSILLFIQDINGQKKKRNIFQNIGKNGGKQKALLTREFVSNVEKSLRQDVPEGNIVQKNVEENITKYIGRGVYEKEIPVYNLNVEDYPEYFANGILVHNCLWVPGDPSPNRMDSLVWMIFGLKLIKDGRIDWTRVVG